MRMGQGLAWSTSMLALVAPLAARAQTAVNAPPVRETVDKNGVDLIRGALNAEVTDLAIGPKGSHGLTYSRSWEGNGWRDNLSGGISGSTYNPVVTIGDISDSFTYQGGIYVADQGNGATLTASGYNYTYTSRDGTVASFYSTAQDGYNYGVSANVAIITSITRPDGTSLHYSYDDYTFCPGDDYDPCLNGVRMKSVTNSFGYGIRLTYQSNSFNGRSNVQYYTVIKATAFNAAVSGCDPNADSCASVGTWPAVTYDAALPTTVTGPDGRVRHYSYTGGQLSGMRRPTAAQDDISVAYDGNGLVQTITKAGSSWGYTYGGTGTANQQRTTVTSPNNLQRSLVADLTLAQPVSITDETNATSSFSYDANGRLTQATAPEGNAVQYAYDARGNVTSTTQVAKPSVGGASITTSAGYDASCSNQKTCDQPNWTRDANGNQTDYQYDPTHGGVTVVTTPAGANGVRPQVRYGYGSYTDQFGATIYQETSTSACRTQSSCGGTSDEVVASADLGTLSNNNYLPLSVTRRAGDSSVSATSSMTYDRIGNMTTATDPVGAQTHLTYDAGREVTEVISADPDGGGPLKPRAIRINYNGDGTVGSEETGTDTGNNFQSLQQIALSYDSYGRKVQNSVTAAGTTYSVTQYGYDGMGRLLCTTVRMNAATFASPPGACTLGTAGSDGPDRITLYDYDGANRRSKVTSAYGTGNQADVARVSYAPNGRQQTATDANGNVTTYAYDGFDRPLTTTYPGGSYEQLGYDADSRVTSRRLRDGQSIAYSYDALGHLTSKVRPDHYVFWETDLSYAWDNLGELVTATDGNGRALGFVYDALGRQTSQSDAWYATGNASFQYDAAGRRTRQTWWDGFYVTYDYDAVGEMTAAHDNAGNWLFALGYDDLGRRSYISRPNGASTGYNYDAASRLSSLVQTGGQPVTWGFGYNAAGQITSRTSSNDAYAWSGAVTVDRAYGVNGLNQYTSSGGTSLGYDGRGNLTSSGSSSYGYTSENQLASSPSTYLGYDSLGRLFNITSDQGLNTTITSEGDRLLTEINQSNGAVLRRYVYGPGPDEPLVWYEGGDTSNRRFLHADERGSIVSVTDNAGNVVGVNTYDEFGIPGANNIGRFQYTGQKWLPALGMYDYKARTYSPTLGRFMQTDPIGYGDGMNWHNYAHGDPVNATDPSGLVEDPDHTNIKRSGDPLPGDPGTGQNYGRGQGGDYDVAIPPGYVPWDGGPGGNCVSFNTITGAMSAATPCGFDFSAIDNLQASIGSLQSGAEFQPAAFLKHPYANIRITPNNLAKLAANHYQPSSTKSYFNDQFAHPAGIAILLSYAVTNSLPQAGSVLGSLFYVATYSQSIGYDRNVGLFTSTYTVQVFDTHTVGSDGKPIYNFVNMYPGRP